MRLRDPQLLIRYMEDRDFSQARLGRYAGVSRQFIHKLVSGETRTCTQKVGELIEEALSVLPETLFEPSVSLQRRPSVTPQETPVGSSATPLRASTPRSRGARRKVAA